MNPLHSKKDPNWCTPPDLLDRIRSCLGTIDLDPFSSEVANKTVQANRFFTAEQDGFAQPWNAETLCINPPGLQVARAWRKLVQETLAGRAQQTIWIGFSVEQLCLLADPNLPGESDDDRLARGGWHPADFSMVILRKRISFVKEDGTTGSPSHGNYLVGLSIPHDRFLEYFGSLGRVTAGSLAL